MTTPDPASIRNGENGNARTKASPAALIDLPELYREVLHSMTDGVSISDESGVILYTNPAEDRMFGYEPGELIGQHVTAQNAYDPEDNLRRVNLVITHLNRTGNWTGEWRNRRKDGTEFYTWARITAVAAGGKRYLVCTQQDITERKHADEELRRRSEDFIGNVTAHVHRVGPDGTIVWADHTELQMLGYEQIEYIGHNIREFLADSERTEEVLSKLAAREQLQGMDAVVRTKDGSVKHIVVSSSDSAPSSQPIQSGGLPPDINDRKLAEHALMRLGAIVESSDDAIVSKALDGTIQSWNSGAERIFGYRADEVLGKHISMLAAPGVANEIAVILNRIATGERVEHFETQRRRKNGEIITVSLTVSPIRDAQGRIVGASKIARDVTERKRTEQALREIERQLMLLIEASSALLASPESSDVMNTVVHLAQRFISADAHSVWRLRGDTWRLAFSAGLSDAYVGNGALDMRGASELIPQHPVVVEDISAEPLLARRHHALIQEGVRSMLVIPLCIHGGISGTVVFYWKNRHRFDEREVRIASALGNLAASALGTADLYDRQTQLRAQAESSERRAAFLAEAGALLASSLDYRETLVKVARLSVPAFAEWSSIDILDAGEVQRIAAVYSDTAGGRLAEELAGRTTLQQNDITRPALRDGQSVLLEDLPDDLLTQFGPDGEYLKRLRELGLRSCIVVPMVVNGEVLGAITFATAGSGRRFSRADLRTAEELARRAAMALENSRLFVRSQEARAALLRSNEELRQANSDLEQFAFSASHDLQEPLRMVGIYSQILRRKYSGRLDAQADEYLGFLMQGAKRMESLIHDLLAYTQALNVGETGAVVPIDAEQVLERVLLDLRSGIEAAGAQVTWRDLPTLAINEVHLVQLFQNLVGNAIKYRSERTPVVEISASEEGNWWKVCVRDNGIGIDPQFSEQVFGIFKRLHRNEDYDGTGIGLAICQKIVHRYGGRIWVESAGEGQGSTFCFTIPKAG